MMKQLCFLLVFIGLPPTYASPLNEEYCGPSLQKDSFVARRKIVILKSLGSLAKSLEDEIVKSRFYEVIAHEKITVLQAYAENETASLPSRKRALLTALKKIRGLEMSPANKNLCIDEIIRGTNPTAAILMYASTSFLNDIHIDKDKTFSIISDLVGRRSDLLLLQDNEKLFGDIQTLDELEAAINYEIKEGVKKIINAFKPLTLELARVSLANYSQNPASGIMRLRRNILDTEFPYMGNRVLLSGAGLKRYLQDRDVQTLSDLDVAGVLVNMISQRHPYKLLYEQLKGRETFLKFMIDLNSRR